VPDIGYVDRSLSLLQPAQALPSARGAVGRRFLLLAIVVTGLVGGWLATPAGLVARAAADAGPELTTLLRGMAAMKALAAGGLVAAIVWRLSAPIAWGRYVAYAAASACMAVGPVLIWNLVHLRLGALLLHAGLLAAVVLLWRDPAVGARLQGVIDRRRAALRGSVAS
jgi:hypothetical protein